MKIKIYYSIQGGHVHMRVYVAGALTGKLCLALHEFNAWKNDEVKFEFQEEK